ncbi:uncharacterized protein N7511_004187 [Penicillium nucicola]|uniref:uncharacterized protein n=1 Tax=Penicillium nucicola TaxID=1850975 RepID=UPI002545B4D4|nr:uncharacterized protein N7511_004187 [Penicillium nucicola]KAJ5766571.1 hypothetical protein N7511_004187 [Penicillium nucicola]
MSSQASNPPPGPIPNDRTPCLTANSQKNGTDSNTPPKEVPCSIATLLLWNHELHRQNTLLATDLSRAKKRLRHTHDNMFRMREVIDEMNSFAMSLVMSQSGRTTREYFETADQYRRWQLTMPIPRPEDRWPYSDYFDAFLAGLDDMDERNAFLRDRMDWESLRTYFAGLKDKDRV